MKELVDSRIKAETKNDNHDLLSNLLAANDDTLEDDMRLTDQELLCTPRLYFSMICTFSTGAGSTANIFIYLIAGHEVTQTIVFQVQRPDSFISRQHPIP